MVLVSDIPGTWLSRASWCLVGRMPGLLEPRLAPGLARRVL